jgi:hypothetical protein
MLDRAGLFQAAWSLGETILSARIGGGSITLSVGDALKSLPHGLGGVPDLRVRRFVLQEEAYPRAHDARRGISYAVPSLLNDIIVSLGIVLALGTLGLDVTKLTFLAGALGVGIGFGLQNVVNNFVSGLILLFERPSLARASGYPEGRCAGGALHVVCGQRDQLRAPSVDPPLRALAENPD